MTTALRTWLSVRTVILFAVLAMAASGLAVAVNPVPAHATWGAMHWPTSGTITSLYNWRCSGYSDNHPAVDVANQSLTTIHAAYGGTIIFSDWSGGYGRLIIIRHPNGYYTRYAHLARMRYAVGRSVVRGEQIGLMGQSGNATGPHLHFEVIRNGTSLNKYTNYGCGQWVSAKTGIAANFDL